MAVSPVVLGLRPPIPIAFYDPHLRHAPSVPQIFQVRRQESKVLEQGMYRKSGG